MMIINAQGRFKAPGNRNASVGVETCFGLHSILH
jgi:hypothetical protein